MNSAIGLVHEPFLPVHWIGPKSLNDFQQNLAGLEILHQIADHYFFHGQRIDPMSENLLFSLSIAFWLESDDLALL